MILSRHYNLFISSCSDEGGIISCSYTSEKGIEIIEKTNVKKPMYTVIDGGKLYAVLRAPFEDSSESGILSFDMHGATLENPTKIESTKGVVACHISLKDGNVYAANYISGSVIRISGRLVQHEGCGKDPARQDGPHAHFIAPTPDNKYLMAVDLGADKIITYDGELNAVCETAARSGSGPRHLAFSQDGRYAFCVNELASSVTMYRYNDGKLSFIDEKSTLPEGFDKKSTAAAIRCEGNKVWASNRGHNSVAEFTFSDIRLSINDIIDVHGDSPRNFVVLDGKIISANEESNNVTVIDLETKELLQSISVEKPICISYNC